METCNIKNTTRLGRVLNLPTAMLPEEQVGWMFHRVCMKEASTWVLPLQIERCCKREAGYTWL